MATIILSCSSLIKTRRIFALTRAFVLGIYNTRIDNFSNLSALVLKLSIGILLGSRSRLHTR